MTAAAIARSSALLLCAAGLLAASETTSLMRDGAYWVESRTGTLPAAGILKVRMRGPVVVRGGSPTASYTIRTRVRARSEAEAQRLLAQLQFRVVSTKAANALVLTYPVRPTASAELEIRTPSSPAVAIETYNGDVEVYDIRSTVTASTGAGLIQMDRIGGDV